MAVIKRRDTRKDRGAEILDGPVAYTDGEAVAMRNLNTGIKWVMHTTSKRRQCRSGCC
jgi:hypothetical protein